MLLPVSLFVCPWPFVTHKWDRPRKNVQLSHHSFFLKNSTSRTYKSAFIFGNGIQDEPNQHVTGRKKRVETSSRSDNVEGKWKFDLRSYCVITTWITNRKLNRHATPTRTLCSLPIACNTDETVANSVDWNQFTGTSQSRNRSSFSLTWAQRIFGSVKSWFTNNGLTLWNMEKETSYLICRRKSGAGRVRQDEMTFSTIDRPNPKGFLLDRWSLGWVLNATE
jgi:hypothetical protein